MFVIKTVFISGKITEYRFGALTEISDKFSIKLNLFSYMILQCWLNILENFITILYGFQKDSGQVALHERAYFVLQK